jgi:hypothetical protein
MPQRQAAIILPRGWARLGTRHRRRQGLQQRFAIIERVGFVARARCVVPLRTAVALPITAVAVGIIARTVVAGSIVAGALGALPLLRAILLQALAALPVAALAFLEPILQAIFTRPVFTDAIIANPVIALPVVAGPILRAIITHPLLRAFIVAFFITAGVIAARTAIIHIVAAIIIAVGVAIAVQAIIVIALAAARVGLAIPIIAEQPEIMFGILQIIFGGHAVAGLLRITRQRPIFFQQLGGVAALAIVEPRAIIVATSHLLRARATVAATPTPALVVSDQDRDPRSWPGLGPTWARCG